MITWLKRLLTWPIRLFRRFLPRVDGDLAAAREEAQGLQVEIDSLRRRLEVKTQQFEQDLRQLEKRPPRVFDLTQYDVQLIRLGVVGVWLFLAGSMGVAVLATSFIGNDMPELGPIKDTIAIVGMAAMAIITATAAMLKKKDDDDDDS